MVQSTRDDVDEADHRVDRIIGVPHRTLHRLHSLGVWCVVHRRHTHTVHDRVRVLDHAVVQFEAQPTAARYDTRTSSSHTGLLSHRQPCHSTSR